MKDKRVSIPMTILSLAIGVIVIFPIIWHPHHTAYQRHVRLCAGHLPL